MAFKDGFSRRRFSTAAALAPLAAVAGKALAQGSPGPSLAADFLHTGECK